MQYSKKAFGVYVLRFFDTLEAAGPPFPISQSSNRCVVQTSQPLSNPPLCFSTNDPTSSNADE